MGWLLILAVIVAFLAAIITTLQLRLAIFDEVEGGSSLNDRRSWQLRLEPKGATERLLLLEHRRRFPVSVLRRKFYLAQSLVMLLFFGLLAVAWYCFGSGSARTAP
jgi:hypothetical protein